MLLVYRSYVASDKWITDEMERMWKEAELLCGRTEKNQAGSQTGETVKRPTFKPSTSQIQVQ
jgi:hypothetical protein